MQALISCGSVWVCLYWGGLKLPCPCGCRLSNTVSSVEPSSPQVQQQTVTPALQLKAEAPGASAESDVALAPDEADAPSSADDSTPLPSNTQPSRDETKQAAGPAGMHAGQQMKHTVL